MAHERVDRARGPRPVDGPRLAAAVIVGLTLGTLIGPALAQAPADVVRAILQLSVNGIDRGELVALVRGPDVLVRVVDLERAGLRGLAGRRETVEGETFVSLASLSPLVAYEMDERALALRLTAQPSALVATIQDFQVGAPTGLTYTDDTTAFLNSSVTGIDFERFTWTGEGGLSVRNMLLYGTAFRDEDGVFSRGLTSFTLDDRARLLRWLVGDRFDSAGPLGGSAQIGGFSLSREFGLDPYFVRFPTVGLSGAVLTRSTAEVYVNGQLLRREQLPPGPFELRNLPAPVGSGLAEVVLRDAFGRQQLISSPFYFTSTLLAAGVQEFSYNLGFKRDTQATGLGEYGGWAVLARHRIGLTDGLSVGGRLELASGLASGGPVVTARLPLGEMELAVGGSRGGQDHGGWAASLAYNYASRPVTLGAAVTAFSDHYATTSLKAPADRPRVEVTGLIGFPVTGRASVTLQHTYTDFRDRDVEQRSSASVSVRLTNRASLFVTALHSRPADMESTTEVFTGLTYFLGDSTTGTVSNQVGRDQNTSTVEVQRSLPLGTGYGYRAQASRLEQNVPATGGEGRDHQVDYNGLAQAQYQSSYGFYEASYQRSGAQNSTMLTAAVGVVAIGGGVHLSRPVQDGFGLIDVGLPGVRGYLNNQEIGRSDSRGKLLVPNLLPYYGNRLGIADQDIPIDYGITTTERLVAPPVRGGSVVSFPTRRVQAFVGRVLMEIGGRTVTPAYGQLTVTADGRTYESPIGRDGEFYLESLPRGRHAAVIEHKEGTCRVTLEAPASPASLVEIGTVRCTVNGPEKGPR